MSWISKLMSIKETALSVCDTIDLKVLEKQQCNYGYGVEKLGCLSWLEHKISMVSSRLSHSCLFQSD